MVELGESIKFGWWSNCPWCAFGVAALVNRDVKIVGRLGGEARSPIPNLWDDEWCLRHRKNKGGILSVQEMFEIAKGWYGCYLDDNWNRKGPNEVKSFFKAHGLDLNFQSISDLTT